MNKIHPGKGKESSTAVGIHKIVFSHLPQHTVPTFLKLNEIKTAKLTHYETPNGRIEFIVEEDDNQANNIVIFSHLVDSRRFLQLNSQFVTKNDPRSFITPSSINMLNTHTPDSDFNLKYKIFSIDILKEDIVIDPSKILKWLIEIIFPIKYLHDNNMYFHNLSGSNLILDKNERILLGPPNFPYSEYYILLGYDKERNPLAQQKYIMAKEIPKLSEENILKEIKGIFLFWFELCIGVPYLEGEIQRFGVIEERYGVKWKVLIENAILKDIVEFETLKDLIGNVY